MANSVTLDKLYGSGDDGAKTRYLQLKLEETAIDSIKNTSTITWTLTCAGGTVQWYSTGPTSVVINDTEVYSNIRVSGPDKEHPAKEFPARTGSETGTIIITHGTDGKKTISASVTSAIYTKTSTTKTGTLTLTNIDRTAPVVSAANFRPNQNSLNSTVNVTVDVGSGQDECNTWQYDYHEVKNDGTTALTSWKGWQTLPGSTDSKYLKDVELSSIPITNYQKLQLKFKAKKKSNGIESAAVTYTIDVSKPSFKSISVSDLTSHSARIITTTNTIVNSTSWQYQINSEGYKNLPSDAEKSGSSASFIIDNLKSNTQYAIYIKAKASLNNIWNQTAAFFTTKSGLVYIKTSSGWKEGQVFIKTNNGWKEAEGVYIKTSNGWKEST